MLTCFIIHASQLRQELHCLQICGDHMELGYQQVIMAEADDLGPFLLDGRSTPALRFHLIALRDRYDLQTV